MARLVRNLSFSRRLYVWGSRGDVFALDLADPVTSAAPIWGRVVEEGAPIPVGFYRLHDTIGQFWVWRASGWDSSAHAFSLLHRKRLVGQFTYSPDRDEAIEVKRRQDSAIREAEKQAEKRGRAAG